MLDSIKLFVLDDWIQITTLAISILALLISMLAFKRSGKKKKINENDNKITKKNKIVEPMLDRYKSIDISLMITAKRSAQNQLRLVLKNTGKVTAKQIEFTIGEPIRVINKEELASGIHETIEINNAALKPRLTVIDAGILFPIREVLPGVLIDIIAVTTMGYGKICDFPISINWMDDRGARHFQDEVVTI